jgi:hypothetical protein
VERVQKTPLKYRRRQLRGHEFHYRTTKLDQTIEPPPLQFPDRDRRDRSRLGSVRLCRPRTTSTRASARVLHWRYPVLPARAARRRLGLRPASAPVFRRGPPVVRPSGRPRPRAFTPHRERTAAGGRFRPVSHLAGARYANQASAAGVNDAHALTLAKRAAEPVSPIRSTRRPPRRSTHGLCDQTCEEGGWLARYRAVSSPTVTSSRH